MREDLTPELLVRMGLVDDPGSPEVTLVLEAFAQAQAAGIDPDVAGALLQAYGRAVGRIANAEADLAVHRLERLPPEEREAQTELLLDELLPLATTVFDAFHRFQVRRLVQRRLRLPADVVEGPDHDATPASVAFVDLCDSTGFMRDASVGQIRALADEVYLAGQEVAVRHDVLAAKFLGDGVLLVSREREALVDATRAAVAELGRRTPMSASAGMAHGPVLRRAGDYYGMPVNLAARLAELAPPETVYADAGAVLPGAPVTMWATVAPRGVREDLRVAVLRPS
ncbi:adenylate/guanylate cyclase domain-containing protein [Conexibacter sp. SYSU D00693]|uniref:adenylate/guanylate cyclase domain-containing protein n=1 Tax=Conexibacter sp. SYSU D00693 TaxID=2812560 RepID=UPI00196B4E89|nr:adenylate/guanylate cyclase domain-containing protein [Conexibacter sp. SYSU D00693]